MSSLLLYKYALIQLYYCITTQVLRELRAFIICVSSLLLSKYALILLYYCITLHRCSESCARSRSRSSPSLRSLWTRKEVVSAFKACGESRATCCRPSQKTSNWPHRLQSGCSNTGAEIKIKTIQKKNRGKNVLVCVLTLLYYSSNWPHRLQSGYVPTQVQK